MTRKTTRSTLRHALNPASPLHAAVVDGMGAVKKDHRKFFDDAIRPAFEDGLDLDMAMTNEHAQANRWDYLLGHGPSREVIAVEPHSAKQDEITTVIRKRDAAVAQLRGHLRDGARVARWFWVSSGKVHFANTEKARRQLDQNGIEFVGAKLLPKHLPSPNTPTPETKRTSRRTAATRARR